MITEFEDDAAVLKKAASRHVDKLVVHDSGLRLTYGAAVRYANTVLPGKFVALSTADVSPSGPGWTNLTEAKVRGKLFGLSRHERKSCGGSCDCVRAFSSCHDTFMFLSPLSMSEEFLKEIDFSLGALWGSENRFLWEVKNQHPEISVINPCFSLVMTHYHCVGGGHFRPNQDQRRVNTNGRSLGPEPCDMNVPRNCVAAEPN